MKIIQLILLAISFSSGILYAQTDFRSGYIINNSGDTLFGEIDYRGDLLMSERCRFKTGEDMIIDYSPDEISAFRFDNSRYFVSKEVNDENLFLEYLIQGTVSLYFLGNEEDDKFFLEKRDLGIMEIRYEEAIVYRNDQPYLVESTWHNELLTKYMQDVPKLTSRINNIKRPERRILIKLVADYNKAVSNEGEGSIYESKRPKVQLNLEVVSGISSWRDLPSFIDGNFMQSGVLAHFRMPASNEKLYLKTGVLYNQFEYDPEKTRGSWNEIDFDKPVHCFKVPVHIEYIYPRGFLRPRFSYGMNLSNIYLQSVSVDLGANVKISESFFVSAVSEIEFKGVIVVPLKYMSHSFRVGVFMKI